MIQGMGMSYLVVSCRSRSLDSLVMLQFNCSLYTIGIGLGFAINLDRDMRQFGFTERSCSIYS